MFDEFRIMPQRKEFDLNDAPPLFQDIFGSAWARMPRVFHAHYANRAGCDDEVVAVGEMKIWTEPLDAPIRTDFQMDKDFGASLPRKVATRVAFRTRTGSRSFWYERSFDLGDGRKFGFISELEHRNAHEVVEWTGSGIG